MKPRFLDFRFYEPDKFHIYSIFSINFSLLERTLVNQKYFSIKRISAFEKLSLIYLNTIKPIREFCTWLLLEIFVVIVVVIQIIQSKFFDKIYNLSHSKDFSKELFPPHNADQPVQEVGLLEKHEGKEENQKLLTSTLVTSMNGDRENVSFITIYQLVKYDLPPIETIHCNIKSIVFHIM